VSHGQDVSIPYGGNGNDRPVKWHNITCSVRGQIKVHQLWVKGCVVCVHMNIYVRKYCNICASMYVHKYIYIYIYIYTNMYVIYIYIHIYIHIYIYTYMYTYV